MSYTEIKQVVFKTGIEVNFFWEEDEVNRFECIIQHNARTPVPHYHNHFDEMVYVKSGRLTVFLNGKPVEVGAGDSVFIPRGTVHSLENRTREVVRFLTEIRPGVLGPAYFEDIADVLNQEGMPDLEKAQSIMRSYGIIPVMGIRHWVLFFVQRVIRKVGKSQRTF